MLISSKRLLQVGWISSVCIVVVLLIKLDDLLSNTKSPIAQIKNLQGTVDMRTEDDIVWSRVKRGSVLANQDLLATSDNSTAEILFNDGRVIQIGPNSQIVLATENSKGSGSNVVRLLRGQVIATTTDKPKSKSWNPLKRSSETSLLISTKADEVFQLNSPNATLSLNKDVESGVTNVLQLSGKVRVKQKDEKAFVPLPPVSNPISKAAPGSTQLKSQPMELAGDSTFASVIRPATEPMPQKPSQTHRQKPLALADSQIQIKPPSVPPFNFQTEPPQTALLSVGSPEPVFPKPIAAVDLPNPSIHEISGTKFCTFDPIQNLDDANPLLIHLKSEITQEQIASNKDAKFVIQASVLTSNAKFEKKLLAFPLKVGIQAIPIDVSILSDKPLTSPAGMKKIPVALQAWTSTDNDLKARRLSPDSIKIELCSFGDLKPQSYRIFVNEISMNNDTTSTWFKWTKPAGGKSNYVISVASTEYLLKLKPILTTAQTFAIETRELDTVSKSVFFLKRGKIIASLRGIALKRSAIELLSKTLESDLVFFGEGESYTPLEDSVDSRISSINRALRENNVVYLLIKGRIVPIKFEDVKTNAVLVRSYLLSTDGVFLKLPKVL